MQGAKDIQDRSVVFLREGLNIRSNAADATLSEIYSNHESPERHRRSGHMI
jgi:hypothetical protein